MDLASPTGLTAEPSAPGARSLRDGRRGRSLDALYAAAIVTIVATGVVVRSRGVLAFPFWLDECSWATFLMEKPLAELVIRPIGFMGLSKAMAVVFGPSVGALRCVPWVAGIATTVLSPFLARRLFSARAARLLFVAAIAFNSEAINYAKEFKPYSLGLFLHCAVLFLTLNYLHTSKTRDLLVALAVAVAAVLFTQDIVFAYPGALLAVLIFASRRRRWPEIAAIVVAGATALSLITLQYVFIWSKLEQGESRIWGHKYDVFFTGRDAGGAWLGWAFHKYLDLAAFPGITRLEWHASWLTAKSLATLVSLSAFVWVTLHVLGVVAIVSRKHVSLALLLLLPLLVMVILNRAGFWPFGAFRTNLFTLPYTSAIAGAAFDWAPTAASDRAHPRVRWLPFLPAFALVIFPSLLLYDGWQRIAHNPPHALVMPEIVENLVQMQGEAVPPEPQLLVLDAYSCDPWNYYTKYNPSVVNTWGAKLQGRFSAVCAETDRASVDALRGVAPGEHAWSLFVGTYTRQFPGFHRMLNRRFQIEKRANVGAAVTVEFTTQ